MRKVLVVLGAVLALLVGAVPAAAGPAGGSTTLLGPAVGGQEVEVGVAITGVYPVVAYEFVLENRCWFGGRFSGPVDSVERYPLLGPWFDASGGSYSEETVSLTDVPSGAVCKVAVSRGSSPVKGTTTPYAVG
ncbi:hypothetical protein ACK8HX_02775 [Oryzobacter sp. R7]|uniref:hypothetical protein n=1 Tax=Oryzobacter faecalis TaxID=3388656 RepID=UPI00398CD6CE